MRTHGPVGVIHFFLFILDDAWNWSGLISRGDCYDYRMIRKEKFDQ
jgi:hypothetical protein